MKKKLDGNEIIIPTGQSSGIKNRQPAAIHDKPKKMTLNLLQLIISQQTIHTGRALE